jgi:hypothetical protein
MIYREMKSLYKFFRARRGYYGSLRPAAPLEHPFVRTALEGLIHDGFVVFPNWISGLEAQSIHDQVRGDLELLRQGEDKISGKRWYFPNDGVYRILEADSRYPLTRRFFEDPLIENVAKSYVCSKVKSYQRMSEIRPDPGASCSSDEAHFDDWKYRFKAFLYLTDVAEGNAPFSYWRGSHQMYRIRWRMEYEYFRDGKKGSYGCYSPSQIKRIEAKFGIRREAVSGVKGTLILADTRGLHAGTPLLKDCSPRVLLANYFDL